MWFKPKVSASLVTLIVIGLALVYKVSALKHYQKPDLIRYDMTSYYGYLPAFIIYGDPHLTFVTEADGERYTWVNPAENGPVFKMTMGVAILNLPAFMVAESISRVFHQPRDGYSETYLICMLLSAVFYVLIGLHYLRKTLRYYFRDWVVALTLLAVIFGTNLYYYVMDEPLMSHVYCFAMYAALWFNIESWHRKRKVSSAVFIGLSMGMLTLIRPIHILCVLLFLLYDVRNPLKWKQVRKKWWHLAVMASGAVLVCLPQLFYWHHMSGDWFFYSYGEERFFFEQSKIIQGWFGFRKGFFVYTPVMLLALPGFVRLYEKNKTLLPPLATIFILLSYIMFSWWCWWYGGSYGSRVMIDLYALLSIPLAATLQWMWMKRVLWLRIIPIALVAVFWYHNMFQVNQYRITMLHWDSMNFKTYKTIFMAKEWPQDYDKLVTPPDYEAAARGERR